MSNLSIDRLRCVRNFLRDSGYHEGEKALGELIAIRELKGDQVPVAFTAARWLDTRCKLSVWTDRESAVMEIGDNSKVAELYDRPQNLVVRPRLEPCLKQVQFERDCEWIEAIDAAGGIVKDDE